MSALTKREEMIDYIKNIDESKLEVFYNRWKEDQKVVGYRANGTPISLMDLKETVARSQEQYKRGEFTDIDDLIKESEDW